jgi:hypothetical protein
MSGTFAAIFSFDASKKWIIRDGFTGTSSTGSGAPIASGFAKSRGFLKWVLLFGPWAANANGADPMGDPARRTGWLASLLGLMRREEVEISEWLPSGLSPRANGDLPVGAPVIDLNEVDFEQLLALGISVGQAARFISQRERRGGISNLNELDAFYGLTPAVRDILRWTGHVR